MLSCGVSGVRWDMVSLLQHHSVKQTPFLRHSLAPDWKSWWIRQMEALLASAPPWVLIQAREVV